MTNAPRLTKAVPSTVSGRRAAPKRRPEGKFQRESEASLDEPDAWEPTASQLQKEKLSDGE